MFKHISDKKMQEILSQVNPKRIALDIASKVYQVYFADDNVIYNFSVKMNKVDLLLNSLSKGTIVAFEACGASQHLGRYCKLLGLEPHIISAALVSGVRASEDKSDSADASAIYRTDEVLEKDPSGYKKLVIIKTEEEQSLAGILSIREDVMVEKTAKFQKLFALAREYGYDFAKSTEVSVENYVRSIILKDKALNNYIVDAISDVSDGEVISSTDKIDLDKILAKKRVLIEERFF